MSFLHKRSEYDNFKAWYICIKSIVIYLKLNKQYKNKKSSISSIIPKGQTIFVLLHPTTNHQL